MLSKEIWKDIEGYEDSYQVSTLGRVFSKKNRIVLKTQPCRGYRMVWFKKKNFSVHRLVMKNFRPAPGMESLQVNHINRVKRDNRLVNLEWCTCQENIQHAWDSGREPVKGSSHGIAKLDDGKVHNIRDLLFWGVKMEKIANLYAVNKSTIWSIKVGKTWGWLK